VNYPESAVADLFYVKDNILYWNVDRHSRRLKDKPAGSENSGYLQVRVKNRLYMNHRIIWLLHYGYLPKIIDHINRKPLDNRIENMRLATKSDNQCNQKVRSDNTTGAKGVCYFKRVGKWVAYINRHNKRTNLGYFGSIAEAKIAVENAREQLHGSFAYQG